MNLLCVRQRPTMVYTAISMYNTLYLTKRIIHLAPKAGKKISFLQNFFKRRTAELVTLPCYRPAALNR